MVRVLAAGIGVAAVLAPAVGWASVPEAATTDREMIVTANPLATEAGAARAYLLGALLMLMVDGGSSEWLSYQYYPYFPLIFFSEAFVNGMIMTALVALRPGWVSSFDDNLYINNK